ncbi:MAG: cyclase family protein [Bacillota bacterium]
MIFDVSMLIEEEMQVYKNTESKQPIFKNVANHKNNQAYETDMKINLHTGTHIDYPLHMVENGKTSDFEDLYKLIGTCKVIDFTSCKDKISKKDLEKHNIEKNDFLLFKTKNSFTDDFIFDFTYLDASGAKYLQEKQVRGVGTDGLGIERNQKNHETHKILLEADIIIIEGLRLKAVNDKSYQMYCLPLKIKSVEATPARVILID